MTFLSALVILYNYLLFLLCVCCFFRLNENGIILYLHIAHWDVILVPIPRYVAFYAYSPWIWNRRVGGEETSSNNDKNTN